MPISVVFDPPLPSDSPSTFNTKAFTLLGDLNDWSTQANALPGEVATNLTTLLASPPAIGSTTPAAVSATTLSASGSNGAVSTLFPIYGTSGIAGATTPANLSTDGNLGASRIDLTGDSQFGLSIKTSPQTTTGAARTWTERLGISDAGAVTIPGSLSLTGGTLGYGIGAGGAVTQATSKATAVTLNKPCGLITMSNEALGPSASVVFRLNSNTVGVAGTVAFLGMWGAVDPSNYRIEPARFASGYVDIRVTNISAGSLSEALQFNFTVCTGATS